MRTTIAFAALFLCVSIAESASGQDAPKSPEEALAQARKAVKEGSALLKQAGDGESDQGSLARKALKLFEQAQELYDFYTGKAGSSPRIEDEISHLQSLIYWSRKMTPLAAEEEEKEEKKPKVDPEKELPGGEDQPPPQAPPAEEKKPDLSESEARAKVLFEQAEKFEKENPGEYFDISAMYFKVVDQYRGTSYGARAVEKCLEYQKKHIEKASADGKGAQPSEKPASKPKEAAPREYEPPKEPTLIRLNLRHPDAMVRTRNIAALASALGKKCLPDLHDMFLAETDGKVLDSLTAAIAGFKDPSTLKFVRKAALERSTELGCKIVKLAAAIGKPDCARIICIAVAVNANPVIASGTPLRSGFVEPYARQVRDAFAAGIRSAAVESLRAMGDDGAAGLRSCLKGRSQVAREAILCLGMLEDHKSSGFIAFYLRRNNSLAFRSEAMASLFIIGIDAVPYMIKQLDNPDLRIWSAYQLREMTGQPFTASAADRWWAWYNQNKKK